MQLTSSENKHSVCIPPEVFCDIGNSKDIPMYKKKWTRINRVHKITILRHLLFSDSDGL